MIQELKIMRGPNIWSDKHHHLIVVKLEDKKIEQADALAKELIKLFPAQRSEIEKIISDNVSHYREKLAALFALVAVELSFKDEKRFHRSDIKGGIAYFAVFEYETESIGTKSAGITEKIFSTILSGQLYSSLQEDQLAIDNLRENEGPSTLEILNEAQRRNIPVIKSNISKFHDLGYGIHRKRIQASISGDTSYLGVEIAGDKNLTKDLLYNAMIPVPRGRVIREASELDEVLADLGYPLVTKPLNGHQGKNITTDITKFETLQEGFRHAKEYCSRVIVEKFISGKDYRFLVIDGKLVAAAERSPAFVIGNGTSTVQQLIDEENQHPLRGKGHGSMLTLIEVDAITIQLLQNQNLNLQSVPEADRVIILKDTANLSTGGTALDVTDQVHPENIRFAERVARVVGLDICGIDIVAPDIETPLTENGGAVIEVNAAPGLRMHVSPSKGIPRKVGKAIIDMLFGDSDGRIPIAAITGTNGKTTTSRLMAHLVQFQGIRTGFTTTEGIYINGEVIVKGDCSGPKSTSVILNDPSIEFAVLECARGGILRSGLAFDECDIGIVTNVAEDHIGLNDVYSLEELARVKAVVPQAVKKSGYAILNAGIDLVYNMQKGLQCKIALFSTDADNQNITEHCLKGGLAAIRDKEDNILILDGNKMIIVDQIKNIPITMNGKAGFMVENILPVALSGYILKFPVEKIREALRSFFPDEHQAPGRMNIIEVANVKVMIDYAHNSHSLKAFAELMQNITEHKTGIIAGVGDRRDQDIRDVGALCAKMYDEIIIRIDDDTRGRSADEIVRLMEEGIAAEKKEMPVKVIPDMKEALLYAIHKAQPGSYIILNADKVDRTIKIVKEIKHSLEVNA